VAERPIAPVLKTGGVSLMVGPVKSPDKRLLPQVLLTHGYKIIG